MVFIVFKISSNNSKQIKTVFKNEKYIIYVKTLNKIQYTLNIYQLINYNHKAIDFYPEESHFRN